jgi:hypothetical protein
VAVGISVDVVETVELTAFKGSSKPLGVVAVVAGPPWAKILEIRLDACSGDSVCVTDGRVMVLDGASVTVTVTTDSSAVEVGVVASIDVAVPGLTVEDADAGFIELPDPEPVTSPVAPAALMRDWALFSLVQAIVWRNKIVLNFSGH